MPEVLSTMAVFAPSPIEPPAICNVLRTAPARLEREGLRLVTLAVVLEGKNKPILSAAIHRGLYSSLMQQSGGLRGLFIEKSCQQHRRGA